MSNRLVEMETSVRVAESQNLVAAASQLDVSSAFVTCRLQELECGLKVLLASSSRCKDRHAEVRIKHITACVIWLP